MLAGRVSCCGCTRAGTQMKHPLTSELKNQSQESIHIHSIYNSKILLSTPGGDLRALMASCGEGVYISLGLFLSPAECV